MQRLEVSGAVRLIYRPLGVRGLTDCALPDDWPVGTETCRSLSTLNIIVSIRKYVLIVGLYCNNFIIMHGMENVKFLTHVYIYLFILIIFRLLSRHFLGFSVRRLTSLCPY